MQLLRQFARVEAAQTLARQLREGSRQSGLLQQVTRARRCAANEVQMGKPLDRFELRAEASRRIGVPRGDLGARLGKRHRVLENARQRQPPAPTPTDLPGGVPRRNRARHGIGGQRAAPRNFAKPQVVVQRGRHAGSRAPRTVDAERRGARFRNQPKAVAAEPGHVRVDDAQRRSGRERGLDRIASLREDARTGLGREGMRCGHHACSGVRRAHGGRGAHDGRVLIAMAALERELALAHLESHPFDLAHFGDRGHAALAPEAALLDAAEVDVRLI